GVGVGGGCLVTAFRVCLVLHGVQLPVRQRRLVQVQHPDERVRAAGAGVYARAGCGWRPAPVEHWRFNTTACHESKKQLTSARNTVTSMTVMARGSA